MDHFDYKDGELHCEAVPLSDIAREAGTPVYVYSTATIRHHAKVMHQALSGLGDPLVAYAVKANPNPAVLAILASEGLGADIVSAGEYRQARRAGVPICNNGGRIPPPSPSTRSCSCSRSAGG